MTQETPTLIPVDDLDAFVHMLVAWHTEKSNVLIHMQDIPEGTEMVVDGSKPFVLKGKFLAGFKAGLELALMELGTLPFVVETEDEPQPAEA